MSNITLIDGTFTGALEVNDARDMRVRIERQVTLDRDDDGSWLIIIGIGTADDDRAPNILVLDPRACRFLDLFALVLADPGAHAGQVHRIEPT